MSGAMYFVYFGASRRLGIESSGTFAALVAATLVAALPATVVASVVAKVVADLSATGMAGALARLYRAFRLRVLVAGAIVACVAAAGAPLSANFLHLVDDQLAVAAAVALGATIVIQIVRGYLQGLGALRSYAKLNVIELVGKIALAIVIGMGLVSLRFAFWIYAAIIFSSAMAGLLLLQHRRGELTAPLQEQPLLGAVRFALPASIPTAALTLVAFVDVVFARHALSARDAGLYGAVALLGRAFLTVVSFLPVIVLPRATELRSVGRSSTGVLKFALLAVGSLGCLVVCASAFAPVLVVRLVAGNGYEDSASLAAPYLVASTALALAFTTATYGIATSRFRFTPWLAAAAASEVELMALIGTSPARLIVALLIGHFGLLIVACLGLLEKSRSIGPTTAIAAA